MIPNDRLFVNKPKFLKTLAGRRSVAENVIDDIDNIYKLDRAIAIHIPEQVWIGRISAQEDIVDQVHSITDADLAVIIGIAIKILMFADLNLEYPGICFCGHGGIGDFQCEAITCGPGWRAGVPFIAVISC
jgi:hypothetical protein